jgi:hypothetical protein
MRKSILCTIAVIVVLLLIAGSQPTVKAQDTDPTPTIAPTLPDTCLQINESLKKERKSGYVDKATAQDCDGNSIWETIPTEQLTDLDELEGYVGEFVGDNEGHIVSKTTDGKQPPWIFIVSGGCTSTQSGEVSWYTNMIFRVKPKGDQKVYCEISLKVNPRVVHYADYKYLTDPYVDVLLGDKRGPIGNLVVVELSGNGGVVQIESPIEGVGSRQVLLNRTGCTTCHGTVRVKNKVGVEAPSDWFGEGDNPGQTIQNYNLQVPFPRPTEGEEQKPTLIRFWVNPGHEMSMLVGRINSDDNNLTYTPPQP